MTPPIDGSARKTLAVGLFFLLLAGGGWLMLQHSRASYMGAPMRGDPGPFFLIGLSLLVLLCAGGVLLGLGLWGGRGTTDAAALHPLAAAKSWGLPLAFLVSLLLMPAAMRALGTSPAVALFSVGWICALLAARSGPALRHLGVALLLGGGAALFVDLVFLRLLTLPLPA